MSFAFDPNQDYGGDSFDPIPAGDYTAEIVEADIRQPRSGDGNMLCLTWKICDGEYENRRIWQTLCYQHSNQQAQDIARRMLQKICSAISITDQVHDPEVFLFKPMRARVGIEKDKNGQYDDKNKITRVHGLTDADGEDAEVRAASPKLTAAKSSQGFTATTSAPTAAKPPPWKKPAA